METLEILLIWAEVNFNNNISSLEQYKTRRPWNNSLIRIDHKPVYFREWLAKRILTVESLIKDETCFLSYTESLNKYHCKSCPLAYIGIIRGGSRNVLLGGPNFCSERLLDSFEGNYFSPHPLPPPPIRGCTL